MTQWGLSDAIGPILVGDNEHDLFLGREIQRHREVSEQTAQLVDAEVKRVINRAYERAKETLQENVDLLHLVADALLERETLTREDIAVLMRGEKLPPLSPPPMLGPAADSAGCRRGAAHESAAPGRAGTVSGVSAAAAPVWGVRGGVLSLDRPRLLGIVNVTPDSFSDGGNFFSRDAACSHAERLAAEGADVIDVGGESTRPQGAEPVSVAAELDRVLPVIREVVRRLPGVPVSVDTVKAAVADAALSEGAHIVNDVSGGRLDPRMAAVCARHGAGFVIMHSRGTVRDMATYAHAEYDDVVEDVLARTSTARRGRTCGRRGTGADRARSGRSGFPSEREQSLAVLAGIPRLCAAGYPLLVGASRKRFMGEISGEPQATNRVAGTVGAHVAALMLGARLFRVHDVRPARQSLDVAWAVVRAGTGRGRIHERRRELPIAPPGVARRDRDPDRRGGGVPGAACCSSARGACRSCSACCCCSRPTPWPGCSSSA